MYYSKSSWVSSHADTGTPTHSTHQWRTYPKNDLMNMFSHSSTQDSIAWDPSRWNSYDVSWKMMLPLRLSNNENRAYWNRKVIGHRGMSSFSYKILCYTWLTNYHQQRRRHKFRRSSQGTKGTPGRIGKSYNWKWISAEKIVWKFKFNPPAAQHFGGIWNRHDLEKMDLLTSSPTEARSIW